LQITHHRPKHHALGTTDFRDKGVQGLLEKVIAKEKKLKRLHPKNSKELKGKRSAAQTQEKAQK